MQYTQPCMKCWKGEKPDRRKSVYTPQRVPIYWPGGYIGSETLLVESLSCEGCPENVVV